MNAKVSTQKKENLHITQLTARSPLACVEVARRSFTLIYNPTLAAALRDLNAPHPGEAAVFLSQMAHWQKTQSGHMTLDGRKWIYNSYEDWTKNQITSLKKWQFGIMLRWLKKQCMVFASNFSEIRNSLVGEAPVAWHPWNTTTWLSLNLEKIYELTRWNPEGNPEDAQQKTEREESPKPASSAEVDICTTGNSNPDDPRYGFESRSIYKENHISHQNRENEKEKINSFDNNPERSDPPVEIEKQFAISSAINPNEKNEDNYRRSSVLRDKRTNKQDVVQEIWEIAIAQPFPAFLNWRATIHYKPQGGKWERDAYGNAYSEFYRNRDKTTAVLFPQFMNEVRGITEKVHQAQSCDAIAANVLPSWFIESLPDPTPENVRQLMENLDAVIERGTRIALPTKSNTPSDITADYHEVHSQVAIKPLPSLSAPVLMGYEAPALSGVEEAPSSDLQQMLARKQAQWNAPILRDRVRRWAEQTKGVVLTENGPQLETGIETNRNNTAIDEIETNRSNTAIEQVETFRNNTATSEVETTRLKVETSNPLVEKQVDKVGTNNHGASSLRDVEMNNPSTEVGADIETSFNSPSSNSERSVSSNNHGASSLRDIEVNNSLNEVEADISYKNNSPSSNSSVRVSSNNHGAKGRADVDSDNQLTHKHTDVSSNNRLASKVADVKTNNREINLKDVVIDDPWECDETRVSNTNSIPEGSSSSTERRRPLIKLMLAVWDNIYELGKLVLDAREEDLIKAVSSLSSHHRAHIKQAATRAWYPGFNRDADYKGERVEIWEVGQSPTAKVRTKRGAFLKVRRSDLKPWLGI